MTQWKMSILGCCTGLALILAPASVLAYSKEENKQIQQALTAKSIKDLNAIVKEKISTDFEIDYTPVLHYLASSGDTKFFAQVLPLIDYKKSDLARIAINPRAPDDIRDMLVGTYVDPNDVIDGFPLIHHMAYVPKLIPYFVAKGADIRKLSEKGEPLAFSSVGLKAKDLDDYLQVLDSLNYPFDLKATDGRHLIHAAASNGNVTYVAKLIERGVDPTMKDGKNNSAIFYVLSTEMGTVYKNKYFANYELSAEERVNALAEAIDHHNVQTTHYLVSRYGIPALSAEQLTRASSSSKLIRVLVAGGLDPASKDTHKQSIADNARYEDNKPLLATIKATGFPLKDADIGDEVMFDGCGSQNKYPFPQGEWKVDDSTVEKLTFAADGTFSMTRDLMVKTDTLRGRWKKGLCGIEVAFDDKRLVYMPILELTASTMKIEYFGDSKKLSR